MTEIIDASNDSEISRDEIISFSVENSWNQRIPKKQIIDTVIKVNTTISWRLTSDFNKQHHLFFEKIQTDYLIDSFICSCGHIETVIKHPNQTIEYTCIECENKVFYDANRVLNNTENFIDENQDIEFAIEYNAHYDENKIFSSYVLYVPDNIDFSNKKITYSNQNIYTLVLTSDGKLEENFPVEEGQCLYSRLNKQSKKQEIVSKLRENLTDQINRFCYEIPTPKDKDLTISEAQFFLNYKHLKEFDFYYWEQPQELPNEELYIEDALLFISDYRKEKSIKKALYENYANQLKNSKEFNSFLIAAFIGNIKDVNIVVSFLKYEFQYPEKVGIETDDLSAFIKFLQQHYSEKQILKLFVDYKADSQEYLFRDTVNELGYNLDLLNTTFNKVSCKIETLHDEFVRCVREYRYEHIYNKELSYCEKDFKPCVTIQTYSIKLPLSGKELYEWADALHNCISSYFDSISSSETIIYGFFQDNVLSFAVEIQDNNIVQYSAKYNAKLSEKNYRILTKWYEIYFKNNDNMERKNI